MTRRLIVRRKKKALALIGVLAIAAVFLLITFSGPPIRELVPLWRPEDGSYRWSDLQDVHINETWMRLRESVTGTDRVTKVILFSYTRGGSTLLSDIFNIDSNSTYMYLWYEALQGFHSFYSGIPEYSNELQLLYYRNHTRRISDARKLVEMTNYLESLLRCRIDKIPITTLTHVFMTKSAGQEEFWSCIEAQNGSSRQATCQRMNALYCYADEYWSAYAKRNPTAGITRMNCEDLIATIRAWKLDYDADLKVLTLLHKYFDMSAQQDLASFVEKRCSKFSDFSWNEIQASMLDENVLKQKIHIRDSRQDIEDFEECTSMLVKFTQFLRNQECLRDLASGTFQCRDAVNRRCSSADLVAASIHRSSMGDLELLIQRVPNIRIVYYVRDPRAIAVSRAEKYLHTYDPSRTWTVVQEAHFICVRMQDDLASMKYLDRKYPGSLTRVRYEDLVRYPVATVTQMFQSFGRSLEAKRLDRWIETVFHAKDDDGMYGVERRNGSAHISKWRWSVTGEDISAMTERCRRVLEELQYEI